jgi:hypothetical protein
MCLFALFHLLRYAFVDHFLADLRVLSHLTNKSGCYMVVIVDEVSGIKGLFGVGYYNPLVSRRDCHINTYSESMALYIIACFFLRLYNREYLNSGFLFGSVSESFLHISLN